MQILIHNLSTGKFSRTDGKETLQATLKKCAELNKKNPKIKHYLINENEK